MSFLPLNTALDLAYMHFNKQLPIWETEGETDPPDYSTAKWSSQKEFLNITMCTKQLVGSKFNGTKSESGHDSPDAYYDHLRDDKTIRRKKKQYRQEPPSRYNQITFWL